MNDAAVGTNSYTVSSCANLADTKTGDVTWRVLAQYRGQPGCSDRDSAFVTKIYSVDKTAPAVPSGLNATADTNGVISASWDAATDTGCGGTDSYWAQVSTDPAFATAHSDSSWANGWTSAEDKSTNADAFPGGTTVYVHVRSRDGLNNQSTWSANISALIPVSVGTIQARAVTVDPTDTSCAAIRAGGSGGIDNTSFQFTPSSESHPAVKNQSGSSYVVFNNLTTGDYGIDPSPPPGYVLARSCWADEPGGTTGETSYATLDPLHTLTWDVGYTQGSPWSQVQGGDVYASGMLQSYVAVAPPLPPPRAFILDDPASGYPGVATYGMDYNFDSSAMTHGQTWVSSKNWLVHDTVPVTDYYQVLYQQFGSPAATAGNTTLSSRLAGSTTPYYYNGNLIVNAPAWTIPSGDKVVVFVSGNLTINTPISITPGGFIAFIVKGNITIAPAVAAIHGIYITSPAGTFDTGTGAVRFVGTGTFIAGNFVLGRNLGDVGNMSTASELFIYDPKLLFTMPDQMKKLSVSWEEVAP